MMYFPMNGVRKLIPIARRVRRAIKGLGAAAQDGSTFHLWFHPTNLVEETEQMLAGLRSVFAEAARLRDNGRLEIRTMGEPLSPA